MSRIWRVALLTLLMALLPLRGWAWAVMPVSSPVKTAVSAPPCHAAAHAAQAASADHSGHTSDHADQHGGSLSHTCSLCDLCHAGVIAPPSWAWFHDAPPVAPPSWAVSAPPSRDDADGLFRPPRA